MYKQAAQFASVDRPLSALVSVIFLNKVLALSTMACDALSLLAINLISPKA